MFHWAATHLDISIPIALSLVLAAFGFIKFLLARHAEFVTFEAHMNREEEEVWPSVQVQQESLREQMAKNHLEAMTMLRDHGARITAVENRMPDGQLQRIEEMLASLLRRT